MPEKTVIARLFALCSHKDSRHGDSCRTAYYNIVSYDWSLCSCVCHSSKDIWMAAQLERNNYGEKIPDQILGMDPRETGYERKPEERPVLAPVSDDLWDRAMAVFRRNMVGTDIADKCVEYPNLCSACDNRGIKLRRERDARREMRVVL